MHASDTQHDSATNMRVDNKLIEEMDEMSVKVLGHDLNNQEYYRTEDVLLTGDDTDVDFGRFGLSEDVMRGLVFEGFEKPAPIQLAAIPIGLTGVDMLMKSKSGTGKTCVFAVLALERTVVESNNVQILVMTPCREIAVQTQFVIQSIGAFKKGLEVGLFIGGSTLSSNIHQLSSHIVVGTPGRLAHMIDEFDMDLSSVKLFVMDEADKLVEESFAANMEVIKGKLPDTVQTMAVSATFENGVESKIWPWLKNPVKVHSSVGGMSLLGVEQYAMDVRKVLHYNTGFDSMKAKEMDELKFNSIMTLVTTVPYVQAVIFTEYQLKAERIYDLLRRQNIDCVLLSGALCQSLRLASFHQFQREKVPILVTTDLGARGLDYDLVNLVINYECPKDLSTYVHRMGRSGRFGSLGRVITLLGFGGDITLITKYHKQMRANINLLLSLDDLKALAITPALPCYEVAGPNRRFTLVKPPVKDSVLTFAEALDFLQNGGQEAFEFAATYCTPSSYEDEEMDPGQFKLMVNNFMVKNGAKPLFQIETKVADVTSALELEGQEVKWNPKEDSEIGTPPTNNVQVDDLLKGENDTEDSSFITSFVKLVI